MTNEEKLQMKLDVANRHIQFLIIDIECIMNTNNFYLGGDHIQAQANYLKHLKYIDLIERGEHDNK